MSLCKVCGVDLCTLFGVLGLAESGVLTGALSHKMGGTLMTVQASLVHRLTTVENRGRSPRRIRQISCKDLRQIIPKVTHNQDVMCCDWDPKAIPLNSLARILIMSVNEVQNQSCSDEQYVRAAYPNLDIVENAESVRIFVRDRSYGAWQFLAEGTSMADAWRVARNKSAPRWSRLFARFLLFQ